jgi:methionine salvage enolase-phosphatase E1
MNVLKQVEKQCPFPLLSCLPTPLPLFQDVMFPYAGKHVRAHLESSYASEETQEDIAAIRAQVGGGWDG